MPVPFKRFQTLVNDQVTATQASSSTPIDFNVGTVELALIEANSGMGMWLQLLVNAVLSEARAQTSTGVDLDTWMAQFPNTYTGGQFTRLPATQSTGNCTFSRFSTSGQALVPVGSQVKTTNLLLQFTVIADTSNPNFNIGLNSYVMGAGIGSTLAKVQCETPGVSGNVSAGLITVISSAITGVDTVNNLLPFTNGVAIESDAAFRARFAMYMQSLSRGVLLAYAFVLASIPQITRYNVVENLTFGGSPEPGFVYTVIDDGTGSPPPSLIAQAEAAIATVRGLSILNAVYLPSTITVNISMDLVISSLGTQPAVTTAVTTALTTFINGLQFNASVIYTRLFEVIYDSSQYIVNIDNLLVNGGTTDLAGNNNTIFFVGTITVSYI
jgi:uncharacterized phage protein gp47/JayE